MKESLKNLSESIAIANDMFYETNKTIDTVIGIMDKTLRQQGMNAEAISVECIPLNKKIIFLIHDERSHYVDIAFGNKEGDISSSSQYLLEQLTVAMIVNFMVEYFV